MHTVAEESAKRVGGVEARRARGVDEHEAGGRDGSGG